MKDVRKANLVIGGVMIVVAQAFLIFALHGATSLWVLISWMGGTLCAVGLAIVLSELQQEKDHD